MRQLVAAAGSAGGDPQIPQIPAGCLLLLPTAYYLAMSHLQPDKLLALHDSSHRDFVRVLPR
jgi:hypothetical protein